jgi:ribonuclease HI
VDDDLTRVQELEQEVLRPEVRGDAARLQALLRPDFVEFGSSGRVRDRDSVPEAAANPPQAIEVADVRAHRLGPDAVLLTYRATTSGRRTLRSSTWIRGAGGEWRMLFHQGTPTA